MRWCLLILLSCGIRPREVEVRRIRRPRNPERGIVRIVMKRIIDAQMSL